MITRSDYTDEEWAEVIARCEVITKMAPAVHEYELGDWFLYDGEVRLKKNNPHELHLGYDSESSEYFLIEKAIWLPRLDQLVRMEGWKRWKLSQHPSEWSIGKADPTGCIIGFVSAPTPELAALRALQRCEERVNCTLPGRSKFPCGGSCSGIHPPGGPHLCLDHAMAAAKEMES